MPQLVETSEGLALVEGELSMRGDFTRMLSRVNPNKVHQELLVKAAKIKGTIVNQVLHNDNPAELVRIGHPAGMIPCYSEVDENNNVKKAAIVRTARRLMEGYALLEKARFE